ncbi:hypothetical protein J4402_05725 [Candidatus Pacearchaeota archaeon]|nr:hypothetical protein [Candidatus Pacearchaeota archaeon]
MTAGAPSTEEILAKYESKLQSEFDRGSVDREDLSEEYVRFKEEMIPEMSKYSKWAKSLGNAITLKIAEKDRARVQRYLDIAHLDVTASQALTLSILSMLTVFFATVLIAVAVYLINGSIQLLFGFLGLMVSMFVFYYTYSMPQRLANSWRLKASAQMVPAILYVVVYMKHTSNLERAIGFASQHLEGPLALDFKKVFYDVEVGKFSTIKQSLESYLERWRDYSPEFVESFHLIESSLFEPSEDRRVEILERALRVMLDGVYEKMLKYSREIRSPLTNIYMLGIILPTLGLALLPLASTLLGGILQWPHVFLLFNIIVPFMVFYVVSEILLKRPGGYGESSMLEFNPDYYLFVSKKPWVLAFVICLPLFLIGILPFIFQIEFITSTLGLQSDYSFAELGLGMLGEGNIFDFKLVDGKMVGPFGPLALLLSLFIPLAVGMFFAIAYSGKTKKLIFARKDTQALETEFANSLFQLGNRIGDGSPAEIAFARVAESTQGQTSSRFFATVNQNIQQLGMSLERAIFDTRTGALIYFPSGLIATSMRILVETVRKGLKVAARSLMSISDYVKNIDKINQRLKDLLAEIVSDMKSNMTFLAPLLAGIVVGLSSMITSILNKLQFMTEGAGSTDVGFGFGNILDMFQLTQMIPPYFLQISVGLYIVEIIFILTMALVTVNSGKDVLMEKYDTARNLKRGLLLYLATALLSILALTLLSGFALGMG